MPERKVFAVVNRENHLPVLVFEQELPDLTEPPAQRGTRLAVAAITAQFRENHRAFPFLIAEEDIPPFVRRTFTVVEVTMGYVSEAEARLQEFLESDR